MSEVKLTLTQKDGKVKEYKKDVITARWIKKGFELSKKLTELSEKGDYEGILDARIKFTVSFFDDKSLTVDSIWDGLLSSELVPTLDRIFNQIMNVNNENDGETGEN